MYGMNVLEHNLGELYAQLKRRERYQRCILYKYANGET